MVKKVNLRRREAVQPPEKKEQTNEETWETGSWAVKCASLCPYDGTDSSDPPVGFDGSIDTFVASAETRQSCDDELDICGSNVEKMIMIDDGQAFI